MSSSTSATATVIQFAVVDVVKRHGPQGTLQRSNRVVPVTLHA
ncbi:MAG: hypothetical protein R2682_08115 [Pyrinomonadaceae bacterium]